MLQQNHRILLITAKEVFLKLFFSRVCPSKKASPSFCILIAYAFSTARYKNYTQTVSTDKDIVMLRLHAFQIQQQDGMKSSRGKKNAK